MKKALALGPVSVNVNADHRSFLWYMRGIIDTDKCGTNISHAVLAVGYGKDKKTDKEYFIIKNSWGKTWGEGGYARIAADQKTFSKGMCGILQYGAMAFVKQENVPLQKVVQQIDKRKGLDSRPFNK